MSGVGGSPGRVLALDPGSRRVGVALSDSQRSMAFPRPALAASEQLVDLVLDLVSSEGVVEVVVGLPMQLNGVEGAAARSARALAEALAEALEAEGVVVTLQDERLSTVAAQRALHEAGQRAREQRAVLDSAAATILLEGFLACR